MKLDKGAILASMAIIMVASVFAGAGTMAYLSDTETSKNNIFTAGTLDLKIRVGSGWYGDNVVQSAPAFFTVSGAKPGDSGTAAVGLQVDMDAWAKIWQTPTSNAENGRNERELEAGDTRTGNWGGELHNYLYTSMWIDDGDGVRESGEKYLWGGYDATSNTYVPVKDVKIADAFIDLKESYPPDFDPIEFSIVPGHLKAGTTTYIGISWRVDEEAGNVIQGDSISFDVMFEVKQYENFESEPYTFMSQD